MPIRHRAPIPPPMYQHIVVEAENLEAACKTSVSDDVSRDTQEMDCDSAHSTTITNAKVIPEGYDVDHFQRILITSRDPRGLPLDMLTLATFLYEDQAKTGPLIEILSNSPKKNNRPRPLGSS